MIAIAAVIVSALTMIIVALQVAEARKANALPATIDLFREGRSAEMEKARRLLTERLPDLDPARGMRSGSCAARLPGLRALSVDAGRAVTGRQIS
jgi:hypothetical protein